MIGFRAQCLVGSDKERDILDLLLLVEGLDIDCLMKIILLEGFGID
jgi:hypothetical protein